MDGNTLTTAAGINDTLTVLSPYENIIFSTSFTDDPVETGGTVTLEFTLDNSINSVAIDNATFTDDLTAMGFSASATADSGSCTGGATWSVTGTTNITGTVSNLPGRVTCTFSVFVSIPSDAPAGIHTNTTSTVCPWISAAISTPLPQPATN
ncbi:hypothetical protein [Breoghania sp.]|uniref:DUF7933 domain-containing protein n=1 Tax=Breoghania sp. TaxID=2065378 RepID=UPI00262460D8|nr:hypothetical protein [Breoghania sp.]MDJ0931098.1 hypothetical protein [Breoghania sp.]